MNSPCKINANIFLEFLMSLNIPVLRNKIDIPQLPKKKSRWSFSEDKKIKEIFKAYHIPVLPSYITPWPRLIKILNYVKIERTRKQIQDRWEMVISPAIKRGDLDNSELKILNELYPQIGNKWTELSKQLYEKLGLLENKYRTPMDLKNRKHQFLQLKKKQKTVGEFHETEEKLRAQNSKPETIDPFDDPFPTLFQEVQDFLAKHQSS